MSATVTVPVWAILAFALFLLVYQALMTFQTRELRRLYEWYLEAHARPAPVPTPDGAA